MPTNEKGFTLLEVLAAVVILGIVIIGFVNLTNFNLISDRNSGRYDAALKIAEEKLNEARSQIKTGNAYTAAPAVPAPYTAFIQDQPYTAAAVTYNNSQFGNSMASLQTVVYMNGAPRLLTVTISWSG
ncbi:type IV pilus modification PilV family protein [Paenibacillus mesophilus]|uniref:type IV pilus modification PilV family protein n=1 Tax=Paenibacillus mesophilus TaxID=2582849 RepID=UPI0013052F93|nr:prepilin-type N-terminal cleavage/methylation domain-containing protein [Paenibacillus mesophilus]